MTNPTRDQILRAYTALTGMCELVERRAGYRPDEYAQNILKALPPKPRPTMAEVEWDDDEHYLAEAEHADWGTMTMLKPMRTYPQIKCLSTKGGDYCIVYPSTEDLTPTGRRYTLTEVQE